MTLFVFCDNSQHMLNSEERSSNFVIRNIIYLSNLMSDINDYLIFSYQLDEKIRQIFYRTKHRGKL